MDWCSGRHLNLFVDLVVQNDFCFDLLQMVLSSAIYASPFKFPVVHILEYVQSLQNPTLCYIMDKHYESSTNVECSPDERHDHNFQRQLIDHCHWLVKD